MERNGEVERNAFKVERIGRSGKEWGGAWKGMGEVETNGGGGKEWGRRKQMGRWKGMGRAVHCSGRGEGVGGCSTTINIYVFGSGDWFGVLP